MSEALQFIVREGDHSTGEALYLPYGTRALKLEVVNNTGRPMKLWLSTANGS